MFVEFKQLNHAAPITGSQLQLPIRADVCYMYSTAATGELCIRRNILNPEAGGICEITGAKPVSNSGAPVQFANFQESARSKDKVGFSFEVKNIGTGDLFEMGTACDRNIRANFDKVYITVSTNLDGLSCTGLEITGKIAEGFISLFDKTKLVTCTQTVTTSTDFKQVVTLKATYDYEEFKQTQITIKSSGEVE